MPRESREKSRSGEKLRRPARKEAISSSALLDEKSIDVCVFHCARELYSRLGWRKRHFESPIGDFGDWGGSSVLRWVVWSERWLSK